MELSTKKRQTYCNFCKLMYLESSLTFPLVVDVKLSGQIFYANYNDSSKINKIVFLKIMNCLW